MKRRRKKKKTSYNRIILILIALAAAAGLAVFLVEQNSPSTKRADLGLYFSVDEEDEAAIVKDGLLSEDKGIRRDGELYFPLSEAARAVNKRIYYDEAEDLVCFSTPTEYLTSSTEELAAEGSLVRIDGVPCLSLSFLEEWTDMACEVFEEPLRIVIRETWPYEEADVLSETAVRLEPSIRSDILTDAEEGQTLTVLTAEEETEGWTCVTTSDGLTGYIETEKLGEVRQMGEDHESPLGAYTSLSMDQKVNMVFYATNNADTNSFLADKLSGVTGVNVIAPTWYFLDGGTKLTVLSDPDIVSDLHEKGYKVFALINDFDGAIGSYDETYETLERTSNRQSLVRQIVDNALETGIDGLNLDVELVSEDCGPAYLELVRELSAECRNHGLYFSVDTYVPMNWSAYLDREELGILADYVVIMCYDEHYEGSEEAGSIASMTFTENGLDRALRMIPKEKLIAAIPFYTRLWVSEEGSLPTSSVMSMAEAAAYVSENGLTVYPDEDSGQNLAEKREGGVTYQIWLEDTGSIEKRMTLIRERDLAGVAEWDLGSQEDAVWEVITQGMAQ